MAIQSSNEEQAHHWTPEADWLRPFSIVIIGGGLAAVSITTQLVQHWTCQEIPNVRITIVERRPTVGPGVAYSTHSDACILNQEYSQMRIIPGRPDHMTSWLIENKHKWSTRYPHFDPETDFFPPRSLYGTYLSDTLDATLKTAAAYGIEVDVVRDTAVDARRTGGVLNVILQTGRIIPADKVIIAVGALPPTAYRELTGTPGYVPSFWPDDHTTASIPKTARVGVLGTRLTAIDAVVTLRATGHTGGIIMASRSGLLPRIRLPRRVAPYRQRLLAQIDQAAARNSNRLTLTALKEILLSAAADAYHRPVSWDDTLGPSDPITRLEGDILAARTRNGHRWQHVLESIKTESLEHIWHRLEPTSQHQLIHEYFSLWSAHRYAMPAKNAQRLLTSLRDDKDRVRGGLRHVTPAPGRPGFHMIFENGDREQVDCLINATDVGLDLRQVDSGLCRNLVAAGLINPHPLGGIDVDFTTCQAIQPDGTYSPHLYAVGYLTLGVHLYTHDASAVAEHARRTIQHLLTTMPNHATGERTAPR